MDSKEANIDEVVGSGQAEPTRVLYERRRWYFCFGWHSPFVHSGWLDAHTDRAVPKGSRPRTRYVRRELRGKSARVATEEWAIVINEHTDAEGWQYARCFWLRLGALRLGGRAQERWLDFVKRRQWVHKEESRSVIESHKRGALQLLTPKQLREAKQEAKRKWDNGMTEVWDLLEQLDSSVSFKAQAKALLDPVALQAVAKHHSKAMKQLQAQALEQHAPLQLPEREVWPDRGLRGLLLRRRAGLAAVTGEKADSTAQLRQLLVHGMEELRARAEDVISKAKGRLRRPSVPLPSQDASGSQQQQEGGAVLGLFGRRGPLARRSVDAVVPRVKAGPAAAVEAQPGGAAVELMARAGAAAGAGPSLSVVMGKSHSMPHAGASLPVIPILAAAEPAGGRQVQAPSAAAVAHGGVVPGLFRQGSNKLVHAVRQARGGVRRLIRRAAGHDNSQDGCERSSGSSSSSSGSSSSSFSSHSSTSTSQAGLGRAAAGGTAARRVAPHMALSLAELECATGHALAIYGDLEQYVGSMPLQSYYSCIKKYTGVPEQDVLLAVWRSQTFEPAHYMAVDRGAGKVVVCIRGTMELVDTVTDLVGRPVHTAFSRRLQGLVHQGILQAARYVVASVHEPLLQAVVQNPGMPVLVTGHSLGGGTAALVALLLKTDRTLLPARARQRVRAVGLAPAAVTDAGLGAACQSFVSSVVYGSDIVPRADVHSLAHFVSEVAASSPLNRALTRMWRALGWSSGASSSPGGESRGPSAAAAAAAAGGGSPSHQGTSAAAAAAAGTGVAAPAAGSTQGGGAAEAPGDHLAVPAGAGGSQGGGEVGPGGRAQRPKVQAQAPALQQQQVALGPTDPVASEAAGLQGADGKSGATQGPDTLTVSAEASGQADRPSKQSGPAAAVAVSAAWAAEAGGSGAGNSAAGPGEPQANLTEEGPEQPAATLLRPLLPPGATYWLLQDARAAPAGSARAKQQQQQQRHWLRWTRTKHQQAAAPVSTAASGAAAPPTTATATATSNSTSAAAAAAATASAAGQAQPPTHPAPQGASTSIRAGQHEGVPQEQGTGGEPEKGAAGGLGMGSAAGGGMGTFLGGLQSGLEEGEALDTVGTAAGRVGSAAAGASPAPPGTPGAERRGKQEDAEAAQAGLPPDVPLVLLAVEPSTFRQMLFFKKSLTDHLPLTYLRVLRAFLKQQKEGPQGPRLWAQKLGHLTRAVAAAAGTATAHAMPALGISTQGEPGKGHAPAAGPKQL